MFPLVFPKYPRPNPTFAASTDICNRERAPFILATWGLTSARIAVKTEPLLTKVTHESLFMGNTIS